MNSISMSPSSHSAQAPAQILAFHTPISERTAMELFTDNLDHIKSLELEASLILAVTYIRRNKHGLKEDEEYFFPSFPLIEPNATVENVQNELQRMVSENRRREALTINTGTTLNFISFSALSG